MDMKDLTTCPWKKKNEIVTLDKNWCYFAQLKIDKNM